MLLETGGRLPGLPPNPLEEDAMRQWIKQFYADMGSPSLLEMIGGFCLMVCALAGAWMALVVILACQPYGR